MKDIIHKYMGHLSVLLMLSLAVTSCNFDDDLPEANSLQDETPPTAAFSFSQSDATDFRVVTFANESASSTTYEWSFPDIGETSNDKDPTVTFPGEGTYTIELIASDALGQSDMTSTQITLVEGPFQPVILEAGFEDESLPDGTGDGRDSWRNSDLGGVIQITGSPVTFGAQGAKLPQDGDRIGYQEITVEADQNYDLRFWYTMKSQFISDPSMTVAILGVTEFEPIDSPAKAQEAILASITVNDTEEEEVYVEEKLSFNSGTNTTLAIYFFNSGVECRLDEFTIEVGQAGAVPPSVGYDITQSDANYLEYTFTNTSTNGDTYLWDFGDNNTSTDESPTHVYDVHDVYTVTLTVTSPEGLSSTLEKKLDIQAPVTADFTKEVDADDYRTVHFMDASIDAVMLLWEFGDGFQFTGMDASHTYREDGTYTVKMTAYSVTGLADVMTMDIIIAQGFVPIILEAGFEDNSLPDGSGDGRDSWRNDLGGVIQITSSPTNSGGQAAKLPSAGDRVGYQRLAVEANTDYTVSFFYTMKTSDPGTLTVAVLDDSVVSDLSEVPAATIASVTVDDQTDANAYVMETISFNSGDNLEIAIFFHNEGVECRIDDFTIN